MALEHDVDVYVVEVLQLLCLILYPEKQCSNELKILAPQLIICGILSFKIIKFDWSNIPGFIATIKMVCSFN